MLNIDRLEIKPSCVIIENMNWLTVIEKNIRFCLWLYNLLFVVGLCAFLAGLPLALFTPYQFAGIIAFFGGAIIGNISIMEIKKSLKAAKEIGMKEGDITIPGLWPENDSSNNG